MKAPYRSLVLATALVVSASAHGADTMLRGCDKEIKKFGCDAKSESYTYDCLYKYREASTKNKGFSRKCYKAYAAYEKETGKGDKVESHQVEQSEHR